MTLLSFALFTVVLTKETAGAKRMLLPGDTTSGHYQIELTCGACHTPFDGVRNESCMACHGEALTAADDSHPRAKFTDPRNAELATRLDATRCVACHREHTPAMTRPMGVTQPDGFCRTCHADVGKDRPSHAGLAFDTCASAGCHNYHDNTALYEDFLVAHADEPPVRAEARVPVRNLRAALLAVGRKTPLLTRLASDAPAGVSVDPDRLAAWETASHARAGVNCTGCHTSRNGASGAWAEKPAEAECATCHDTEVKGFFGGRHGMRVAAGLARMRPGDARLPMKAAAARRELSCTSCHGAHDFETRRAAVTACLTCHDDRHSRAFEGSAHQALWMRELAGSVPAGTGVSCATCHLPRLSTHTEGVDVVTVDHNQNANLRPNERMARTVCLACHGLGFSLDALADPGLIASNFTGKPLRRVAGIDMAMKRLNRPN